VYLSATPVLVTVGPRRGRQIPFRPPAISLSPSASRTLAVPFANAVSDCEACGSLKNRRGRRGAGAETTVGWDRV
jgi:hypothetical protein